MIAMVITVIILIGTFTIANLNDEGEKPPLQVSTSPIYHVI